MAKKWIQGTGISQNKGLLHQNLGIPKGQKIPIETLERATHMSGKVGERARLAMTLRKMRG